MPQSTSSSPWRRPAQHYPLFPHLAIVPALLAIATAVALFVYSDVNAALLWSQCHAHSVLPALSRIPILGTPSCFLVGFLDAALDSSRSKAVLSVILAFVGSLLTVSTVESARRVNAQNPVVSRPTLPWLLFNLAGGALVWQLVIVPAFILAAKTWRPLAKSRGLGGGGGGGDEARDDAGRRVAHTEVIAIPVAVALGFYVPTAVMLSTKSPVAIASWLFFPAYVSLIRRLVRHLLAKVPRFRSGPLLHFESCTRSLVTVYAVPILCSLLAHGFIIGNWAKGDDRKEMTRSTVKFIEIDFQFIGLTFLYWVFVEVGWRAPLVIVASSILMGPGAGTALGWLYREKLILYDLTLADEQDDEDEERACSQDQRHDGQADERTPLVH